MTERYFVILIPAASLSKKPERCGPFEMDAAIRQRQDYVKHFQDFAIAYIEVEK